MLRINLFTLLMLCCALLQILPAQDAREGMLPDILERLLEGHEEEDIGILYEQVAMLLQDPVDINKADFSTLMNLPLMDELTAQAIIEHRESSGKYLSLLELQIIDNMSKEKYLLFSAILTCVELFPENTFSGKKMELLTYSHRIFPLSLGYLTEDQDKKFTGSPWRQAARLRYRINDFISCGITFEKDAGEPAWQANGGPDHSSFYVHYRKRGRQLILGDFHADFGQGLTLASSRSIGKSSLVLQIKKNANGFRPYGTWNEGSYFRGMAADWTKKRYSLKYFISLKRGDAGIDSSGEIGSRPVSGLHRNVREMAAKSNLWLFTTGGRADWGKRNFRAGISACRYFEAIVLQQPFFSSASYPSGFFRVGADYQYNYKNAQLFGELSFAGPGAYAFLNGLLWSLGKKLDIALLYRNYAPSFPGEYSNAFGEFSGSSNESGLYMSAQLTLNSRWRILFSGDVFFRPQPAYRAAFPQRGKETLTEAAYHRNKNFSFYIRYRQSMKERNGPGSETNLSLWVPVERSSLRFHTDFSPGKCCVFRTRLELSSFRGEKKEQGALLYQDIVWKPPAKKLQLIFRFSVFRISDYDARIYAYENDVLYSYLVPAYSDNGSRYYLLLKRSFGKRLDLWVKYSSFTSEDRQELSSGLDLIKGGRKQELKIQLRWQL
jgi:hypothetical protein